MTTLQKILLTVAIGISVFAIILSTNRTELVTGSVARGSEYQSTTTRSFPATSLTDPTILCPDGGVLGSVVVTGANTGVLNFYNGTTTSSHSLYATTTIATLPASLAAGTYTFDAVATIGLIFDQDSGIMPTTTITYKCN